MLSHFSSLLLLPGLLINNDEASVLGLLLQPAAFIYEQCGQPISVCMLAHYYSQTGGIRSLGSLAQAVGCTLRLPAHYHLGAEIYSAHRNWHIFYCCYHKETRQSAPSGLLFSETFPHLHASFMKLQRNTVKILQRLSITLSPSTLHNVLNS